jgi:hypothetical protein
VARRAAPHVTGVAALYKKADGDKKQAEIVQWFASKASAGKIGNVPAQTPNFLLYKAGV